MQAPRRARRAVPLIAAIVALGLPTTAHAAMIALVTEDNIVVVVGDDGDDSLFGGTFNDILNGGGDNDEVYGDSGTTQ